MIELEKEIMASFLAYPQQIDEFLAQIPKECFTQKGQRTLEILIELLESQSVSKNAFVGKLSKKEQEQDYFLDILSSIPNPSC